MGRVKLSTLKFNTIKLVIFGCILLYLGTDLLVWHGPLWHAVYGDNPQSVDSSEVVAEVYGEPITLNQLNRHEAEQDALAGRKAPESMRCAAMLMELVRGKLLRIRTRYNTSRLPDCKQEANDAVARLASRAKNDAEFEGWLKAQGYSRQHYTDKLRSRLQAAAILELSIKPHNTVSEEEVERVYEQLRPELKAAPSRPVKHIFLELLHQDPAAVEQQARNLLSRIEAGEDFATLAKNHSQDLHTAPLGGELGIIEEHPDIPLPELPLFGENAIAPDTPTLAKSRWGWHILQAGNITPARELTLDECRSSIRSALESVRREQALDAWFKGATKEGFTKKRIKINVK